MLNRHFLNNNYKEQSGEIRKKLKIKTKVIFYLTYFPNHKFDYQAIYIKLNFFYCLKLSLKTPQKLDAHNTQDLLESKVPIHD